MSEHFHIKLLADCPEHIPALSELWFQELGKKWVPGASVERAFNSFKEHLNINELPQTLVMLEGDQLIGTVSLRDNDGIREDLTPWLGTLIVHPDYRRQGVGETLVEAAKMRSKSLGFEKLHLFVLDPALPKWYQKLGWKEIAVDRFHIHPVSVMEISV